MGQKQVLGTGLDLTKCRNGHDEMFSGSDPIVRLLMVLLIIFIINI